MRLFVAAVLPQDLLEALSETSASLRDAVRGRYVAPDSLHVTLAFLGEVDAARLDELTEALACACANHQSIEATLGELGSFGSPRRATLWQAVHGCRELPALADDVRAGLAHAGFAYDQKGFLPHVTLMRAADLTRGQLPMPCVERGTIRTVALFRSDLSGPRPRYEALETFDLS